MQKLILLILAALLAACSVKPSDEEVRSLITAEILKDNGEQMFKVENFKKINAFAQDKKTYVVDVKYDLVLKKDLKDLLEDKVKEQAAGEGSLSDAIKAGLGVLALQLKYGNVKAGHRVTKEQKLTLIKTERGWRVKPKE